VELKFIGDRSSILETNYSFQKTARKNDKNAPKIGKNCAKIVLFLYIFRIFFLKFLRLPLAMPLNTGAFNIVGKGLTSLLLDPNNCLIKCCIPITQSIVVNICNCNVMILTSIKPV